MREKKWLEEVGKLTLEDFRGSHNMVFTNRLEKAGLNSEVILDIVRSFLKGLLKFGFLKLRKGSKLPKS